MSQQIDGQGEAPAGMPHLTPDVNPMREVAKTKPSDPGPTQPQNRMLIKAPHSLGYRPKNSEHVIPIQANGNNFVRLRWDQLPETKLKVKNLPRHYDTLQVYNIFSREGQLSKVELILDANDNSDGIAIIVFTPPPKRDFWRGRTYYVRSPNGQPLFRLNLELMASRSPVQYTGIQSRNVYPETLALTADSLEFGVLYEPEVMKPMFRTTPDSPSSPIPILVRQNLYYREIEVEFPVAFRGQPGVSYLKPLNRDWTYKLVISHTVPMMAYETTVSIDDVLYGVIIISVEHPPEYKRKCSDQLSHREGATTWIARNSWNRATDILYDLDQAKHLPAGDQANVSFVNVARWKTFRLVFDLSKNDKKEYDEFLSALRDFNINVRNCPEFRIMTAEEEVHSVFEYLSKPRVPESASRSFKDEFLGDQTYHLAFEVRYQLEVCISEGYLNEYNLSKDFLDQLNSMDKERARELLVEVAAQKKRIFKPMTIFRDVKIKKPRRQIPKYCFYVHTATVTPTTMYVGTPSLDVSNRIVRQYSQFSDCFLRVRFTDERPKVCTPFTSPNLILMTTRAPSTPVIRSL